MKKKTLGHVNSFYFIIYLLKSETTINSIPTHHAPDFLCLLNSSLFEEFPGIVHLIFDFIVLFAPENIWVF